MKYWLMKSEPEMYSIDDLVREGTTLWEGVRNFQARSFMRDGMEVGDLMLFYHSNASPSGVAGVGRISRTKLVDTTAFDPKSQYFDPKSRPEKPVWFMVEVAFVEKFPRFVSLQELRNNPKLESLLILKKGSRLSITPVTKEEFTIIRSLGKL